MLRKIVACVVFPFFLGLASSFACGPSFSEIEKAAAGGDVSAKLAKCRTEARQAYYVEHKSEDEALARYNACKARELDAGAR